jgi:hypothetical protein
VSGGYNPIKMFDDLRKPDFLGVGCVKTGTTWVWRQLSQHPGVGLPRQKELRYLNFVSRVALTPREYLESFQGCPADRKTGEITPDYIAYPHVPVLVKALCPDARIFAVLRDPTERAFSHYKMKGKQEFGIPGYLTFEDAFFGNYPNLPVPLRFCSIRNRGLYSIQLGWWYDLFPPEQIKLLFFDDIQSNPLGLLRDLYGFLGLDSDFVPPDYMEPRNVNLEAQGMKLTAEERARVSPFYHEEIERLEKLTGRDLSQWR